MHASSRQIVDVLNPAAATVRSETAPEQEGKEQSDQPHNHQDHPDGVDVEAAGVRNVHAPREDGANCDEKKARSDTHAVSVSIPSPTEPRFAAALRGSLG